MHTLTSIKIHLYFCLEQKRKCGGEVGTSPDFYLEGRSICYTTLGTWKPNASSQNTTIRLTHQNMDFPHIVQLSSEILNSKLCPNRKRNVTLLPADPAHSVLTLCLEEAVSEEVEGGCLPSLTHYFFEAWKYFCFSFSFLLSHLKSRNIIETWSKVDYLHFLKELWFQMAR